MEITILVEGMMCPHCEARVKATVEAVPGVISAFADHKTGKVSVTASEDTSCEEICAAITAQGYAARVE